MPSLDLGLLFSEKIVKAITIVSHNKTKVFVHLFQKVAVSKGGALVARRNERNSPYRSKSAGVGEFD